MLRLLSLACLLASPALADDTAILTDIGCPYTAEAVPDGYSTSCAQITCQDEGLDFQSTLAVITPKHAVSGTPVIYIPGGPGDAPVGKESDLTSILSLFPGRSVITMNPRGVEGTQPRPICTFDPDFWHEELTSQRETEIASDCRDSLDLDMAVFDAPYLARDVTRMVRAMNIERAGVFGVSYGTESVLHLLTDQPDWLDFAILDSVSLPGALGAQNRLIARDRFLGIIDRLCFTEKQCPRSVTKTYSSLMDWAAQFDHAPVELTLGPDDAPWSLDSLDMLEFLSSMASYPDGAGYGPLFIESFESSRSDTVPWIASEMEVGFDYAIANFTLLFGAFSDSAERKIETPKAGSTRYPFNADDQREFARLFKVWNKADRTEARFVGPDTPQSSAGIPVLVLSGGADSLTPVNWADDLERRFSGLTRFVFPELGHAVSFGTDVDVDDESVAKQLNCGPDVVRAFVSDKEYGDCAQYMLEATND